MKTAALLAAALAGTLADLDPENADRYVENAEAYIQDLQTLYAWADEGMRSVPEAQRYLVTSHDAFQYFGAAFGWQPVKFLRFNWQQLLAFWFACIILSAQQPFHPEIRSKHEQLTNVRQVHQQHRQAQQANQAAWESHDSELEALKQDYKQQEEQPNRDRVRRLVNVLISSVLSTGFIFLALWSIISVRTYGKRLHKLSRIKNIKGELKMLRSSIGSKQAELKRRGFNPPREYDA